MESLLPQIINVCLLKVSKSYSELSQKLTMVSDEQDFDLLRDIKFHQAQLRQRCVELIRLVSKLKVILNCFYKTSLMIP